MPKSLTGWITANYWTFFKRWEYQTTWSASWETCMQVRKQQLELDMEQWTVWVWINNRVWVNSRVGDGQGGLACCDSWGRKELDTTEQLKRTELNPLQYSWAFLVVQMAKNLPALRETWVQSLGWEDPLEDGVATHTSILAWRIRMDREAWGLKSMGFQIVGHEWTTKHSTYSLYAHFLEFF